jgi:lysozyme family protein
MPWCDRLPAGIDYAFFDACVNAGPAQAARTLQRALGLRADGNMGDVTLGKVHTMAHTMTEQDASEQLIRAFCDQRRAFYRALAQFPRYGRGWLARVDHVEKAAKAMAAGADVHRNGLSDDLKAQASARAQAEKTKAAPLSLEAGAATTTSTVIGASATDMLGKAAEQLGPFAATIDVVKYMLLGIAVVSILLTLYAAWHRNKIKEATG